MGETLRVGILNDMAAGPPATPNPAAIRPWLQLACDELRTAGRLRGAVEFIDAWGLGLPAGTAAAVARAFQELVAREVLLIVGPAIGDNALAVTPLVEAAAVPTLNWAGAERARGAWMFHLQVGSHEDESIVLARHLATSGAHRVGVVYDDSPIGIRHLEFLQSEAALLGVTPCACVKIAPLATAAGAEAAELLRARPDAIVYLGLGLAARPLARALAAGGFSGPRLMNTAGIRGYDAEFARAIDGWIYVDMHSDHNRTLAALRARPDVPAASPLAAAKGHDLGRLVAEALARAPELSRAGVRAGLERIKYLPAAQGHDGTLLGFGVWDRGALHGRYLVLRQWRDGASLQVPTG